MNSDKEFTYRRILSIDGGGIRGVILAILLDEMERRTGKPISDLFDLVATMSTGGILALGLVAPGENNKSRYRARDLLKIYEERGRDVFKKSGWRHIPLWDYFDEKYSDRGVEAVMKEYSGDLELRDSLKDILITSYNIERRKAYFFKSSKTEDLQGYRNHLMRDIARATSDPAADTGKKRNYYRFNVELSKARENLDAADNANIKKLKCEANRILSENSQSFGEMCEKLRSACEESGNG